MINSRKINILNLDTPLARANDEFTVHWTSTYLLSVFWTQPLLSGADRVTIVSKVSLMVINFSGFDSLRLKFSFVIFKVVPLSPGLSLRT